MNPFGVTGQHAADPFAAWNARQQVAIRASRDREWREAGAGAAGDGEAAVVTTRRYYRLALTALSLLVIVVIVGSALTQAFIAT